MRTWLLVGVLAATAVACSDDSEDPTPSTTTTPTGPTTGQGAGGSTSATGGSGAGGDATGGGGMGACSDPPLVPVAQDAVDDFLGSFLYVAQNTLETPVDVLEFTFTGPQPVVGQVDLTDADYATCQTCVVFYRGCDGNFANCEKSFLANAGSFDITTSDTTFAGTLEGVNFVEVTIEQNGSSTPVPNGESFCWGTYAFSAEVQMSSN